MPRSLAAGDIRIPARCATRYRNCKTLHTIRYCRRLSLSRSRFFRWLRANLLVHELQNGPGSFEQTRHGLSHGGYYFRGR